MSTKTEDPVVLFGTEKNEVAKRLGSRLSLDVSEEEAELVHLKQKRSPVHVFCPSGREELEELDPSKTEFLMNGRKCVVFTPVLPSVPRDVYTLVLRESSFSIELLSKLVKGGFFSDAVCPGGESMFWAGTGSLLPFFIHNLNNILARIMGNIELAKFSAGNSQKAGVKLEVALEGAEELGDFLEKLAMLSTSKNDDSLWTSGNEAELLELGRMSSGSSVEFNFTEHENAPARIPVLRSSLNSVMGLIIASAVVSVNGCGRIDMEAGARGDWGCFDLQWESHSRGAGLCPDSFESSSTLLAMAAASSTRSGMVMMVDERNDDRGAVSLCVPLKGQ